MKCGTGGHEDFRPEEKEEEERKGLEDEDMDELGT